MTRLLVADRAAAAHAGASPAPSASETGEALTPRGPSRSPLAVPAPSLPRAIWLTSLTVVLGSPGEFGQLSRLTLT